MNRESTCGRRWAAAADRERFGKPGAPGCEDIREAHRVMDANQAKGKMVVVI